ncbi:MAG: C39 family peptidase [Bilifractor sp.]
MGKGIRRMVVVVLSSALLSVSLPVYSVPAYAESGSDAGTRAASSDAGSGTGNDGAGAIVSAQNGTQAENTSGSDAAEAGTSSETRVSSSDGTDAGSPDESSGSVAGNSSGDGVSTSGSAGEISEADKSNAAADQTVDGNADEEAVTASSDESSDEETGTSDQIDAASEVHVFYSTHVQNYGWMQEVSDGAMGGTSGQSLRMESIRVRVTGDADLQVRCQVHVQNYGWMPEVSDGEIAGTSGQGLRMEALRLRLTGSDADKYSIYYRVHAQNIGWMGWAKNGEDAGTTGQSFRLEAIEIQVLPNTENAPENNGSISVPCLNASLQLQSHVQNIGWMGMSPMETGTTGRGLRMEAMKIRLNGGDLTGSILYRSHIQNVGWESGWAADGSMSGTQGRGLQMEAVQIQLSGDIAAYYDVYYRVHIQNYGWLGWAKNGEEAGSAGCSYRIEALQVVLRLKGNSAPGSTANAFVKDQVHLNVPCLMQNWELPTGCESVALTNALKYYGFSLSKTTIADHYMPYGNNVATSFVGNPHYSSGAGIYPPGIVTTANNYLKAKKSSLRAYDITGTSIQNLYKYLDESHPVLVWGTIYMSTPTITSYYYYNGRRYPWYPQEHCMVLKGYNKSTGQIELSDSISGNVTRSASRFAAIYDQIGRFAVVIR